MRLETLTFVDGDIPPVKAMNLECFLAVVRYKDGKIRTIPAYYLNAYPLEYPDGCETCPNSKVAKCPAEDGDGCPTTGWFHDESNFEYDHCYQKLSGDVLEWAAIPQPPQAAKENSNG